MFRFYRLTVSSMRDFAKLNMKRLNYNSLNKDFFKKYNEENLINKFFLRREVFLIKFNKEICSYVWLSTESLRAFKIKALYVDEDIITNAQDLNELFSFIKNKILKSKFCKIKINPKDNINIHIKSYIPSSRSELMELYFYYRKPIDIALLNDNINIRKFIIKQDEEIRCYIQNVCFHPDGKNTINVNDIKYEEKMSSFVKDGLVFAQVNNKDIGFGQYIMNGYIPYIVNICVLPEYQKIGAGKRIVTFILQLIEKHGYNIAKLKVESNNKSALNLYLDIGFEIVSEECVIWLKLYE